ncbi:MAG: ABC transporter ATP-binding protein [bacterium]
MIKLEDLSKRFGDFYAVRDLSLEITTGEIFCFLGPNGAGKTTTLKMLTGLLAPTAGRMSVAGIDVRAHPLEVKKIIGYIPDTPFLYERLTPVEFFRFTGDLYDIPRSHVEREMESSFAMFALDQHRHVLISDLSHGMRQRLAYCCTFLHSPKALFIDEPLVGLDPHSIKMIKNLLIEKAGAGTTIFLTTHILALAEDIAHRIGIISGGRLVAVGTMNQLNEQSGVDGNLEEVFLSLTRPATTGTHPSHPNT